METKINSLIILIYLRKDQITKDGKCSIMLRATVNGKPLQLSTKMKVKPSDWDSNLERVKGNSSEAFNINSKIEQYIVSLKRQFQKIELLEGVVTVEKLKKSFIGESDDTKTIIGIFDKFLQDFKVQVEVSKNKSPATLSKYECTYRRLKDFIREKYNKTDIVLNDLRLDFITDFEIYLRTEIKCSTNSVMKYMQQLRTMILIARNNGWIEKDPFASYKLKKTKSVPRFLTQEELDRIAGKKFSIERLERVRDYFLFSSYTGLAFIDLKNLKWANIQKGLDGELWIDTKRVKTGTDSIIPLMGLPLSIIEKYNETSERNPNDTVFNIPTNQKLNSYLKETADI